MEGGGGSKSVNVQGLKKGQWTAAEDAILMEYVRKNGEGNWNYVQKNSGLMRCSKSCRLRWANHLRPNLKKGSFTTEEERIIIDLHAKLGNKWAHMASQLPGRTDNEINNFWNTRMKRRQRAGLPIYPQEFHEDQSTILHPHHQQQQQKHPNASYSSSSSSFPFSSFLSSRKSAYNPSLPFLESITLSPTFHPIQNHFHNSFYSNPTLQFKSYGDQHNNNNNNNNNVSNTTLPLLHSCNNVVELDNNMSFTPLIMGDQTSFVIPDPVYPNNSTDICLQNADQNEMKECIHNTSSGLLDTLLMESHNLLRKEKLNHEGILGTSDKGKQKVDHEEEHEDDNDDDDEMEQQESCKRVKSSSTNSGIVSATNHSCDDISSSQSSIGMKPNEKPMEEMNSMDDDLFNLLDNFPWTTPLPEWYRTKNVGE